MNNIKNNIIIDLRYLLRYKEFLLNTKKPISVTTVSARKTHANFCPICDNDCICMNSSYKLMLCSKYYNKNVFPVCR